MKGYHISSIGFWPVELKQEAQRATYCAPEYNVPHFWRIGQGGHLAFLISQTRGPMGQCRSPMSPEYNKRVKNLTSEWNQNQQPTCSKIIAMHSVCCCSLLGWKTRFIRWGTPPPTYFCPALDLPLGRYGQNTFMHVRGHEHFILTKFRKNPLCDSVVKADYVFPYNTCISASPLPSPK